MARKKSRQRAKINGPDIFSKLNPRRVRPLILPRYLAEEADSFKYRGAKQDHALQIIQKWADLELQGHLARKETSLDADFLLEVFGEALGYKPATQSPAKYHLERNFTVPGVGTADGALGEFAPASAPHPVAVIELKDADTDLDRDRFNGRTPVRTLTALPANRPNVELAQEVIMA